MIYYYMVFMIGYNLNKQSKCSPSQHNTSNTGNNDVGTCYSKSSLIKMADAIGINTTNKSKKKLWTLIKNKFSNRCNNDEECWKNQPAIKQLRDVHINLHTFKRDAPREWKYNKNAWLNTNDIYYVLKQFEHKFNDFKFLGAVPSDCPLSIHCQLSNINIAALLKKHITKIGVVYNLDTSHGPGTHWVGLYVEIFKDKRIIEIDYYDSIGDMPIKSIRKFIILLAVQAFKYGFKPIIIYNDRRHQYGGSECGMYSINFILERLHGTSMHTLSKHNIKDNEMTKLRDYLYDI